MPRNWRIEKMLLSGRTLLKTTKIGRISYAAWSGITNSESILLRSWLTEQLWRPTFLIKLLLPRVQESRAAKLECREIHERIWVFLDTFLIVTMLDEILMNYTIIQEIWQHRWESLTMSRILRKEGIENSGSEEPLQSIPLPCSSERAMRKRLNDKYVLLLWPALGIWTCTQVAWQFRVISTRRCICNSLVRIKISALDRELPSRSLRKGS